MGYTLDQLQEHRAAIARMHAGKQSQLDSGYTRRAVQEAERALRAALWALDIQIAALSAPAPDPLPHPSSWDAPRLPLEPPAAKQAAFAEQASDLRAAELES